jgi:hypothetical protein
VFMYFDQFRDAKLVVIDRKIERSTDQPFDNARLQAKDTMTIWADSESDLQYTYEPQYFNISVDGETLPAQYAGIPVAQKVSGEVPWDSSVWEYWDKNEKIMKIIIPYSDGDEGYFPRLTDIFR